MSEDRLETALQDMQHESVDADVIEAARVRVWGKVTSTVDAGCAEFRQIGRASCRERV